ncbi:MAG: hypothetical protein K8W52_15790 [Deltaproteobacteria bacterium]|nr:hypothetical protein [Deltaproteobacteria bacterium]
MDRSRITAVVTVTLGLLGCQKTEAEKTCDGLIAQLAACHLGPDPLPRSVERYCLGIMNDAPDPARGESLLTVARRALQECGAPAACPAFGECLARHGCVMLMASPTDEPQFQCSR